MLQATTLIRPARPEDADHMARLINTAGEGLPLYFWGQTADGGQDPWEIGRNRAQRDEGGFSWRNGVVAQVGSEVAALTVTYPIGDSPVEIADDVPAIFVPLLELENNALGTQYVNVLATYERFRGQGHGTRLLKEAETLAGRRKLSIIVSDGNENARRLYERFGFRHVDQRPIATARGWSCNGRNWLLLIK